MAKHVTITTAQIDSFENLLRALMFVFWEEDLAAHDDADGSVSEAIEHARQALWQLGRKVAPQSKFNEQIKAVLRLSPDEFVARLEHG